MGIRKIGILGGSGFVGRSLADQLSNAGHELKVLTRKHTPTHQALSALSNLEPVASDVRDQVQLSAHLSGPRNYTLQELVEYTASCTGRNRVIIPLPDFAARMQGLVFDLAGFVFPAPGIEQPFSTDNYRSMQVDAVCRCNDLEEPGLIPTPVESIVPAYLANKWRQWGRI